MISIRVQITTRNLPAQSPTLQKRSLSPEEERDLSQVTSWEQLQLWLKPRAPYFQSRDLPTSCEWPFISLIDCGRREGEIQLLSKKSHCEAGEFMQQKCITGWENLAWIYSPSIQSPRHFPEHLLQLGTCPSSGRKWKDTTMTLTWHSPQASSICVELGCVQDKKGVYRSRC